MKEDFVSCPRKVARNWLALAGEGKSVTLQTEKKIVQAFNAELYDQVLAELERLRLAAAAGER